MELKTRLLIWWILMMIQAITCRPANKCDFINRIDDTMNRMKALSNNFLSANGKNIILKNPILELDLKNLSHEEKMQKAQCGLHFMQKALRLILQHQKELHESTDPIIKQIIATDSQLAHTNHCVAEHIGNCTNIPVPHFQVKDTYERRQWGYTVLKTSVDFLKELVKFQHHASSKPNHP
ncbi:uncharacterized protein osm isoform X2 [Onychostoma macrolepis]|uniref:Uncharacterized protein n=1 Tax=Onychostoma macrolepis TaxID=369639 RepID=A0A7J6D3M3_9TELE|nr:uncharacterized protein osm isoform X2 [Onychostoma macrolepis]KAF4113805.1 hypothetical protein G5714_006350 [Onychostoma macrolepis]